MKKLTIEQIQQIKTNKYNLDLLIRHLEKLEHAIKKIKCQLDSGYLDKRKLESITKLVDSVIEDI